MAKRNKSTGLGMLVVLLIVFMLGVHLADKAKNAENQIGYDGREYADQIQNRVNSSQEQLRKQYEAQKKQVEEQKRIFRHHEEEAEKQIKKSLGQEI